MAPWLDCAPCHSLPDRNAGNRPTTPAIIRQSVKGLSNSRPHTWASEGYSLTSVAPSAAPFADNRPTTGAIHPKFAGTSLSPSLSCPLPVPTPLRSVDPG